MKYHNINDLVELVDNPRTITKHDFEKLKKSIAHNPKYFEARPLIVSSRTGEFVVIGGNQRLRASRDLGFTEVPIFVIDNLSEEEEQEIIIRDNVNNGNWDYEILANSWDTDKLLDWGVDIPDITVEDVEDIAVQEDISEIEELRCNLSIEQSHFINTAVSSISRVAISDPMGVNTDSYGNALYYIVERYMNGFTHEKNTLRII